MSGAQLTYEMVSMSSPTPGTPPLTVITVADLYRIIFSAIVGGKDIPAGPDGHYFAENGAVVSSQYTCGIAKTLYDLGLLTSPEVKPYTPQEMEGVSIWLFLWR